MEEQSDIKVSKDVIANKWVVEKVKEIRQNYSKAVVLGWRSRSGKTIYEHYEKLVQILGSTPNVSDNFDTVQEIQIDENEVNLEADHTV